MTSNLLTARAINVSFGDRRVLRDVDLAVRVGEIVGVTGRSGCGKTTLLRVLAGLRAPDSGSVEYVDGSTVTTRPRPGRIAVLAQHPRLVCNPRWTLRAIVAEPARIRGAAIDVAESTARAGLDVALLDRYPAQVSDGQLQRACLARALIQGPTLLLCDEPTAMLDPIATEDVTRILRSVATHATGIVLVSHDRRLVESLASSTIDL